MSVVLRHPKALAGLLVLLLPVFTACATGTVPVVWSRDVRQTVAQPFLTYAASGGPVLVEVLSPPPGLSPAQLAATIPAPMTVRQTRWTSVRDQAAYPDYHMVLSFGAGPGASAEAACQGKPEARSAGDRLLAVWCHRGEPLSEVTARAMTETLKRGPTDGRARTTMGSVVNQMFPRPDTGDDDSSCGRRLLSC